MAFPNGVWERGGKSTLRPSPNLEGLGCREDYFEAHWCGSFSSRPAGSTPCLPFGEIRVWRLPPRLAATQLARSAVLNRLIAPTGLSPALRRASRTHRASQTDPVFPGEVLVQGDAVQARRSPTSLPSRPPSPTRAPAKSSPSIAPTRARRAAHLKMRARIGWRARYEVRPRYGQHPTNAPIQHFHCGSCCAWQALGRENGWIAESTRGKSWSALRPNCRQMSFRDARRHPDRST